MRYLLLALIVLLGLACSLFALPGTPSFVTGTATPVMSATPWPSATPLPSPTATRTPQASPTSRPAPTATVPVAPGLDPADVHIFPQPVFAGDWLSADVDPRLPDGITSPLTLTLAVGNGQTLTATVEAGGLDAVVQARFYWAWEITSTASMPLTFTLLLPPGVPDPDVTDNVLVVPVSPRPAAALLPPEPAASWTYTETPGFRLHYLTHSAAERDLPVIIGVAEAAYADVTTYFDAAGDLLDIYLLDRVIGQGGYASSDWVAVSYTDRQYTPVNLGLVLRHELTHRLDAGIGCQDAPALLREGLAVYVSGGHYWKASIAHKAAAIRASRHYISPAQLVENFYTHQHEASYMEAGAFVAYIVETYGWPGLKTLCSAIAESQATGDAERLNVGLAAIGAAPLPAFAAAWEAWLASSPVSETDLAQLDAELHLLETMRAYQLAYDPGAHFLEGILFSPAEGVRRDIVADFVRHRRDVEAITLELMLVMAQDALRQAAVEETDALLRQVDGVLAGGFPEAGLAADVRAIVAAVLAQGHEPFHITARDDGGFDVQALSYAAWPEPDVFEAARDARGWVVRKVVAVE